MDTSWIRETVRRGVAQALQTTPARLPASTPTSFDVDLLVGVDLGALGLREDRAAYVAERTAEAIRFSRHYARSNGIKVVRVELLQRGCVHHWTFTVEAA